MDYEIVGPWTYKEFVDSGLNKKVLNAPETLDALNYFISFVHNGMEGKEQYYLDLRDNKKVDVWKDHEFLKLKRKRDRMNECLGYTLLTSTESEGITGKGIRIEDKVLPFREGNFSRERNIFKIQKNGFVGASFGLFKMYQFLKRNDLTLTCYGEGNDNGNWKGQITLDFDYEDGFLFYSFDDPFVSPLGIKSYLGILKKQ